MIDSDKNNTPDWIRLSPELEHFDPFEGLVDFSKSESKDIRYGYKICNMNLLFSQSIPCEIVSSYSVYSIPNTPKWIRGLINHRGNLIPIFDLYKFWSMEKPQDQPPLLIFDKDEEFIGLYMDAFPLALETEKTSITDAYQATEMPVEIIQFINASYKINDTQWYEIDLKAFMKHITRDYSDNELENQII